MRGGTPESLSFAQEAWPPNSRWWRPDWGWRGRVWRTIRCT